MKDIIQKIIFILNSIELLIIAATASCAIIHLTLFRVSDEVFKFLCGATIITFIAIIMAQVVNFILKEYKYYKNKKE